ncbi:hypothetical protein [Simkania negevensis]|uniref:Uncharacterized protein n=1 Tax=Simkania negevensis (strain ATCC VR-1471 / DSM 27360 / Z) TaxID=331113 RepID=F8L6T1_SIMNZ|nr:hypothetical protein [Simkania negevensis]CCB88429.1 unknown protein [Simkania negevensis Z]
MDSVKTDSSAAKSSFTNYFPPIKDVATRAAAYGATSLLLGRVDPVALSISTLNAVTVSFASQFSKEDDKALKKAIIAVISLFATTFIAVKVSPALVGRVAFAFTQDVALKLACFNALGEAVLFSLPYLAKWNAPKLPESVEELEKLTEKNFLYMRNHFEDYAAMSADVFTAFVTKLEEMKKEDILPKPPKSLEEIQQLDVFSVHFAHAFPDKMNTEISAMKSDTKPLWEALHTRFFEQDLSLPRGDTIENVIKVNKGYYHIKIDPLPSLEQVQGFSINKLSWLYCQIGVKFEVFATYSINDQIALNKIFDEKFKSTWHYSPTMANIADLSDESAKELHAYYDKIIKTANSRFICLPMDVKNALNERFTKLTPPLASFGTTYKIPDIEDFKKPQVATTWHKYFTNNPEEWAKVDKARQEAFNNLFKGKKLAEIAITHKD